MGRGYVKGVAAFLPRRSRPWDWPLPRFGPGLYLNVANYLAETAKFGPVGSVRQ